MFELLPIGIAFLLGLLTFRLGLPPLIGYLFAGFLLSNFWQEGKETLTIFAEFGITILLFSIGLKLKIGELIKKEVLGTSLWHFTISLIFFFLIFSIPHFGLDLVTSLLIALALTFSSTVYVIKLLEERGDEKSRYGRIAIGILIIQDIIAVGFIAFSANKIPSLFALVLLLGIWPIRMILLRLFSLVNHGELLILFGIVVALSGAFLFDAVNIKGDLGALIFGYLLSSHPRVDELNKALLSFKNFFLLGFFLSIGMQGMPSIEQFIIAALLSLALPLRGALYYYLFNRSGLRSQTSLLSSAGLFNYSEFGLIVASISVTAGWLDAYWLSVIALAISFSYIAAAFLNKNIFDIYEKFKAKLYSYQRIEQDSDETKIVIGNSNIIILGVGRVGRNAFKTFTKDSKLKPIGFDSCKDTVEKHQKNNINVQLADVTGPEFWYRVQINKKTLKLVILAMPLAAQNIKAAKYLRAKGYTGKISSIARYSDEIQALKEVGVDQAYDLYTQAGVGFAESSKKLLTK